MCGFVGFISPQAQDDLRHQNALAANTIFHRGPDADGHYFEDNFGVCFRRLAIIDLTDSGNQPMVSRNQRYVLVFNGEIYNFKSLNSLLRKEFLGLQSDSAVLLELISQFGIHEAIQKIEGMFSIAIWDKQSKEVMLIRDRAGEKPLYFGESNKLFVFGSEIQIFKEFKKFSLNLDSQSIKDYTKYSCIPAPKSIYKNVFKVLPGHMLRISIGDVQESLRNVKQIPYWDITKQKTDTRDAKKKSSIDSPASSNLLEDLIEQKIKDQMISDAPLGAFLSGGIDSSLIVSLMQKNSIDKVKTFSIGFEDNDYNEANHAKKVAAHLGTDHTQFILTEKDLYNNFYNVIDSFDEPHADPSNIPTYLLSSLAKKEVTVALSGDGGDELFGGYSRHSFVQLWQKFDLLPTSLLNLLSQSSFKLLARFEPLALVSKSKIGKAYSVLQALSEAKDIESLHKGFLLNSVSADFYNVIDETLSQNYSYDLSRFADDQTKMMALDFLTFLPNLVLSKVDRASMSQSLETRAPLLNHLVIEEAFKLPANLKINSNQSKIPLRNILHKYVPRKIIERPKMGFGIPRNNFLRGHLRDAVYSLPSSSRLGSLGIFNLKSIEIFLNKKFKLNTYNDEFIWSLIILDRWLEKNSS
jgi:asparagine synthase (glutamine-hydrolysing)